MKQLKNITVAGVIVIAGSLVLFSVFSGSKEVGEAINDSDNEVMMQQIDVQNPAFQAGTAPLGENEAETGYLHSDGKRYYNGQVVGGTNDHMINFEMEVEDDPVVVEPTLTDENGNPIELDAETEELLENVYQDE